MQQSAKLQTAINDQPALQNPAQLLAAFQQFGKLSDQLQQSYQELDNRAAQLTQQLACAQDERLKQLAEKEQLAHSLEALLNAMPTGVLLVDKNDTIKTANPAAELFLQQNLSGKKWQKVYALNVSRHTEQDLFLNSGRILGLKSQPLDDNQGQIILLDDVTDQRMLESLADRENRLAAMGQMAAGLAHQLRTPLASAVLYASQINQFIQPDSHTTDSQKAGQNKAVEKVRTCLRYLEKLINDMLMYAKGGEFSEQMFLLDELLVTFNTRIENKLRESDSQLKIISQLNNIKLTGSLDALVSVLINLAENAMDVTDDNCQLELEVYKQADYLILVMRDNGPGISVENQAKIFQAFFSQREGGTGLGLAVAQSIVQAHHGDLLLRSKPGEGSNFYVCLPLNRGEQFLASGLKKSVGENS